MNRGASVAGTFDVIERLRHWGDRIASSVFERFGRCPDDPRRTRELDELAALLDPRKGLHSAGELSVRRRAERIAAMYRDADLPARAAMLNLITRRCAPGREELERAIASLRCANDDVEFLRAEADLRVALDAPRAKFFAQFNLLPGGVKFLVDMRAELLALLPKEPALEVLRVELDKLLESWFDPGFLELRRITWRAPALVLEKLMAYEAVHPIESWSDLRNRLDADRRCYAFFHPRLQDEPLIFVEVALCKGMPQSVQALLDQNAPVLDPRVADTAVFYSISNTQQGLRGISLGNLLLKRVIDELRGELPQLAVFATLSPIPGFREWLTGRVARGEALPPPVAEVVARPDWWQDGAVNAAVRGSLMALCAHYLMREKIGRLPRDPVARFHLANGARVSRICWLADVSERGLSQSCGMMASYRYVPGQLDANRERFLGEGRMLAARRVLRLLRRRHTRSSSGDC